MCARLPDGMLSKLPHPLGHGWTCAGCAAKVTEAWACDACHTVLCDACHPVPHDVPAGPRMGGCCNGESASPLLESTPPPAVEQPPAAA